MDRISVVGRIGATLALLVAAGLLPAGADAFPGYSTAVTNKYPNAATLGCLVCHISPAPTGAADGARNVYGQAFEGQPSHSSEPGTTNALTAIDGSDSDGDSFPNGVELNYGPPGTYPGDANSHPPIPTTPTPTPTPTSRPPVVQLIHPTPTLGEIGLIGLAALVAALGAGLLRRRK